MLEKNKNEKNNYLFFIFIFFDISLTRLSNGSSLSSRLSSSREFPSVAAIVNSNSFFLRIQLINKCNYLFVGTKKYKQGTLRFITTFYIIFIELLLFSMVKNFYQNYSIVEIIKVIGKSNIGMNSK